MKGTVIKRGSKWTVVIDAGRDADGKRIRKWHSGYPTKKAAEEAQVEILSRLQRGEYVPPSKVTVGEWLELWIEGRTGLADTTIDGYRRDVQRASRGIGSQRLRELTPSGLSVFYKTLTGSGLAPNTVKNTHAVIHKALADAVRQGVLTRNPAAHVELPRADRPDTETWTAGELRKFLDHAKSHRLSAAWQLMCSTGMRRSEVLGVRWPNLDLDAGKLAVVDTVVPVGSKPTLRLGETKSRRS